MFFTLLIEISSKKYNPNDPIIVYSNKISPYHNPFETYDYYSLPFCPCKNPSFVPSTLSDAFLGNRLRQTAVTLNFAKNVDDVTICTIDLNSSTINLFKTASKNQYYYQLFVDKLPVWGYVGFTSNSEIFVYTRQHFTLSYNTNRVIQVNLTNEAPMLISSSTDSSLDTKSLKFTYSATWESTTLGKEFRRKRSDDRKFFQNSIRYYQILRSVTLVLFIIILTIIVMIRAVGNDFSRFQREAEFGSFELDFRPEKGWKMIHADVFRTPPHFGFLSILIAIGSHVSTAVVLFLAVSLLFGSYFGRSTRTTIIFTCYSIAAFIGGYFGGGIYKRWGGKNWVFQLLICSFLVPGAFIVTELVLNCFAYFQGSSQATGLFSLLVLIIIVLVIICPLTFAGGLIGRHHFVFKDESFRVGTIRRTIPPTPFYLKTPFLGFVSGLIGIMSVTSEIYYILCAMWQLKMDYVWSFLLVVAILLIAVMSCLSILETYSRLNNENHEWQWSSFVAQFCICFYIFVYSIFYYFRTTTMNGMIQTVYFFAYTAIFSCVIGVVCGFVGFISSAIFVKNIYKNLKTD